MNENNISEMKSGTEHFDTISNEVELIDKRRGVNFVSENDVFFYKETIVMQRNHFVPKVLISFLLVTI